MNDYVLFQMWEPARQSLIAGHLFYVEQARKRLLSQFEDIEAEAHKASQDWLEEHKVRFDPNHDDEGSFVEAAHQAGIQFYTLLSEMRDQTVLSVVAGMFHEWDKQFRDWLVREIQHWNTGDSVAIKVWSADFGQIAELVESFGWKISNTDYFRQLDACRLVVNVYKHGEGKSLNELKQKFPEYLPDPFSSAPNWTINVEDLDHTHLKVSKDRLDAFSDAIVAFWRAVPKNISQSKVQTVPDWFGKAILKDIKV